MPAVYERFTDRARKVMQLANQEAQRFNHEYIGTEHILLGLVKEGSGVAANVLKNLDIDLRKIRLEVEKIVQAGPDMPLTGKLPQTARAMKVIKYAAEESRKFNHNYVGTEHLLLGLLRVEDGVAAQALMNLGLHLEAVREETVNLLGPVAGPVEEDLARPAAADWPAEVKRTLEELDAQIKLLTHQKEEAYAAYEFPTAAELRDQADKLIKKRETVTRQWRARYAIDPSWLSCNEGAVAKLARTIAAERRWQELPALAEALEAAGCTNAEMLDHCRQRGEHGGNCWVIDLLLGTD